jgi:hypothetical protein
MDDSGLRYPVLITAYAGGFELRIRELLVIVRTPDLADGWRQLRARLAEVIDMAAEIDALDQLPEPAPLPPLIGPPLLDIPID